MPALPVHRRQFDVFLSHAHADREAVARLRTWLERAGVATWFDGQELEPGGGVGIDLLANVPRCKGGIVVLSPGAIRSGWVKKECDVFIDQANRFPEFQVIPVCIEDCEIPDALRVYSRIDVPGANLSLSSAEALLNGIYRLTSKDRVFVGREVYVSRSWRDPEAPLADRVCKALHEAGFRLIGDAKDQLGFLGGHRVESIIQSCGALVAILPRRAEDPSSTSPYILREIEIAREHRIPVMAIPEDGVQLPAGDGIHIIRPSDSRFGDLQGWLDEAWVDPSKPHYAFLATRIDEEKEATAAVRRLINRVARMPCHVGDEIRDGSVQETIVTLIRKALFVIADLTEGSLNTAIEAGIARGAGVQMHLIAKEPRKQPAFLFRDLQVWHYENDAQLLATVHKLVRLYRRRVLNDEMTAAPGS